MNLHPIQQRASRVVADYLRSEQDQGRLNPAVHVDAAATLLLGVCFERGSFQHRYGRDVLPPAGDGFAPALVDALQRGAGAESTTHAR